MLVIHPQRRLGAAWVSVSRVLLVHANTLISPSLEVPTMTSLSALSSGKTCVKCGTSKVGTRSCCARDGTWFKKCGDAGDTTFDHTWAEGIQACKGFSTPVSVKSPLQIMCRRMGSSACPLKAARMRNDTQQQTNSSRPGCISNTDTADCKDCVKLGKFLFSICALFIISNLKT